MVLAKLMKKNNKIIYTGERLEKSFFNRASIEHLHRYAIAKELTTNKIVLDIASGEGYGTHLLSENAKFVYGVDIDFKTIAEAKNTYIKENIKFLQGSTSKIPLDDNTIDVVVSFETIEHHNEHHKMMTEIKRVLKKDGILIISTPDKKVYSDDRNYSNPFHVKELYKEEFEFLIKDHFSNSIFLDQTYTYGHSFIYNKTQNNVNFYTGEFKKVYPVENKAKFLISIASDVFFQYNDFSIFNASPKLKAYDDSLLIKSIKNSYYYRIGRIILYPFAIIKRTLKK